MSKATPAKLLHALSHDELQIIVQEIDELVGTEFCEDMCERKGTGKPFSWQEAEDMAEIIGKVYLFAHKLHCNACRDKKYDTPVNKKVSEVWENDCAR